MKTIYKILAGVAAIIVVIAAFMAYFIRSADLANHIIYDGFGRVLSEPPLWAKFLITNENSWAGFGWHLFDIIWFFGGLYIAYWLHSLSEQKY